MNFFFSRSVAVQESSSSESGTQSVTAADIKRVLREIIEEENKKKPYSDRLLGEKLAERGISISPPDRCQIQGRGRHCGCQRA